MASGSAGKKGTLYAYAQRSSGSGKDKSHPRVQSGPLRHGSASRLSRYSPVTGRRETKSVETDSATVSLSQKGMHLEIYSIGKAWSVNK